MLPPLRFHPFEMLDCGVKQLPVAFGHIAIVTAARGITKIISSRAPIPNINSLGDCLRPNSAGTSTPDTYEIWTLPLRRHHRLGNFLRVTGTKPALENSVGQNKKIRIVIGTIGRLAAEGKTITNGISGAWESYVLQIIKTPCPASNAPASSRAATRVEPFLGFTICLNWLTFRLDIGGQTVRDVAKEENCALIDLNGMSRQFYRALRENLDRAFQDGTHHNNYGSYELAKCVVLGIRENKLPLAKSIVPDFGDFDPAQPDAVANFGNAAKPRGFPR